MDFLRFTDLRSYYKSITQSGFPNFSNKYIISMSVHVRNQLRLFEIDITNVTSKIMSGLHCLIQTNATSGDQ